jgi:hypothetical protein
MLTAWIALIHNLESISTTLLIPAPPAILKKSLALLANRYHLVPGMTR